MSAENNFSDRPITETQGATDAYAELYGKLHAFTHKIMKGDSKVTLQPTALVNEVWLKLRNKEFTSESHLFAVATKAIRAVRINYLRAREARKRREALSVRDINHTDVDSWLDSMKDGELAKALQRLQAQAPAAFDAIVLSYCYSLEPKDIGRVLGTATGAIQNRLTHGRSLLRTFLTEPDNTV